MPIESELATQVSSFDPLGVSVELPYRALYFPFGFPAQIETNHPGVIRAAHQNWSDTRLHSPAQPALVRVVVSEGGSDGCPPLPVYRAQRNLFSCAADAENIAVADLAGGFATAWVTEAVLKEVEYFRYCFLLGMAGSLIEAQHLVSLHAACVVLDGQGILLTGESGAGKSSLAFACATHGFTYVSDDCSAIVRKREGRSVVGTPGSIRFRETAGELFPELRGRKALPSFRRQPSIEVRTADLPGIRTSFEADVDHVVILNRDHKFGESAELVPITAAEARSRLFSEVWPRELPWTEERSEAVERVLGGGTYELRYRDLEPAISRLAQLVRSGL